MLDARIGEWHGPKIVEEKEFNLGQPTKLGPCFVPALAGQHRHKVSKSGACEPSGLGPFHNPAGHKRHGARFARPSGTIQHVVVIKVLLIVPARQIANLLEGHTVKVGMVDV